MKKTLGIIVILVIIAGGLLVAGRYEGDKSTLPPAASSTSPAVPLTTYTSSSYGFSIGYPAGYAVDPSYTYQDLGPDKSISGVKFTVPASYATGTNLGSDTYVSVERLASDATCGPDAFLEGGPGPLHDTPTSVNGMSFIMASSTGAGAGNRYEETVSTIAHGGNCYGVRLFLHYSVIENYPPGMVTAFDRDKIMNDYRAMLGSLKFTD